MKIRIPSDLGPQWEFDKDSQAWLDKTNDTDWVSDAWLGMTLTPVVQIHEDLMYIMPGEYARTIARVSRERYRGWIVQEPTNQPTKCGCDTATLWSRGCPSAKGGQCPSPKRLDY